MFNSSRSHKNFKPGSNLTFRVPKESEFHDPANMSTYPLSLRHAVLCYIINTGSAFPKGNGMYQMILDSFPQFKLHVDQSRAKDPSKAAATTKHYLYAVDNFVRRSIMPRWQWLFAEMGIRPEMVTGDGVMCMRRLLSVPKRTPRKRPSDSHGVTITEVNDGEDSSKKKKHQESPPVFPWSASCAPHKTPTPKNAKQSPLRFARLISEGIPLSHKHRSPVNTQSSDSADNDVDESCGDRDSEEPNDDADGSMKKKQTQRGATHLNPSRPNQASSASASPASHKTLVREQVVPTPSLLKRSINFSTALNDDEFPLSQKHLPSNTQSSYPADNVDESGSYSDQSENLSDSASVHVETWPKPTLPHSDNAWNFILPQDKWQHRVTNWLRKIGAEPKDYDQNPPAILAWPEECQDDDYQFSDNVVLYMTWLQK